MWFSNIFKGYRKETLDEKGLISFQLGQAFFAHFELVK